MNRWNLRAPVAFIVFNRPDTTERVFTEIANARPSRLLVVADGPRANREGEAERCLAVRRIVERVDWKCDVLTNYSDINLGCKRRVASGLDWVFENVEEAIVLEDDCLPHVSFFRFCDELLEKYRDEERVAQIGGANFQFGRNRGLSSYYYSAYTHIWGWASWRRAWRHYDVSLSKWPSFQKTNGLGALFGSAREVEHWTHVMDTVHQNKIDTWDYQWMFANWHRGALSVVPNVNMISNIGFSPDATHTKESSRFAGMPVTGMSFPLQPPVSIQRNIEADAYTDRIMFRSSLRTRLSALTKRLLGLR